MQNDNPKFKNIIITVDDFGYNREANTLIFEAIEKGVIGQASTMVNMSGTTEALSYIKDYQSFRARPETPLRKLKTQNSKLKTNSQFPNSKCQTNFSHPISNNHLKFGLHLNLTEGRPLADPKEVPSLVGNYGQFLGWPGLIKRAVFGQLRSQDVERETRAQIEKLQTVVEPIPFLNSHHHIHLWPSIAKIIIPLCHEYGITHIRWPRKIWWRSILTKHGLKALAVQLLPMLSSIGYGRPITDYFFDLDWLKTDNFNNQLSSLPLEGEVSCHPPTLAWLVKNVSNI